MIRGPHLLRTIFLATLISTTLPLFSQQWTNPSPEELSMSSQEGYPGIAGVYLNREEITEDKLHMWSVYVRLKVLTEKGKDYANVELKYGSSNSGGGYTVNNIAGRTIHPDGTIIPFTGKPYEKLIEKTQGYDGYKYMAKVFTMPDVEIGSIIEYRYSLRYDDNYFFAPSWFIQSDLYLRKGHYLWKPTNKRLVSNRGGHEQLTNGIGWFPILPKGAQIQQSRLPPVSPDPDGQLLLSLDVHDVPPAPQEEHMPPISSFTYRVLFYYSPYRSGTEYWQGEGKYWSKNQDKFIGPGPQVVASVHELTAPSDSQEQKLRKIYAAVMRIENTDFTRKHEAAEDKAAGFREVHNTDDVLDRRHGTSDQLTELFVAMARAAGMKAYVFAVTSRDRSLFTDAYLNMSQLDDYVAVVNIDGKEVYFDPGSRYCPYGHLEWKHTMAGGIRQIESGTALSNTPGELLTFSNTQRIAEFKMDEHGEATGVVKLTYTGAPAIAWRHRSLLGDDESFRRELRTNLEHMLPGGVEVKVTNVMQLETYEQPLIVEYSIKGPIGSPTGKRLFVPADLFLSNAKPAFPHEKRELAVYFDYPNMVQDAIRIHLPATITAESVPSPYKEQFEKSALYTFTNEQKSDSITVRRNFILGEILFDAKSYPALRTYYSKVENKDQENIVLTNAPQTNAAKPAL